jgi:hypothetical protein
MDIPPSNNGIKERHNQPLANSSRSTAAQMQLLHRPTAAGGTPDGGRGTVAARRGLAKLAARSGREGFHLALLAGVLPVTRQSGGKKVVGMRYACDHALRDALFHGAWVASCRDPHWKARYLELRGRGKTHAHALRIIGAQLLRVAIALLKEGVPYDRSRLKRRTDLKESNQWLVAEPAGLAATGEREPVMALGG